MPDPSPFGPSVSALRTVQHLSLVLTLDAYRGSLTLTIPRHPGRLNRPMLAVTASTRVSTAVPTACFRRAEAMWRLCPGRTTGCIPPSRYNSYMSSLVSHHALVRLWLGSDAASRAQILNNVSTFAASDASFELSIFPCLRYHITC